MATAAMVGGAFLSASLQVLFDRLASRDFINIFRGRKQEERVLLQNLKIKLLGVKPLLNDAELKQWTDSAVKEWVDELKDTIYHADDLLDEIATKAMQSKLDSEYPTTTTTTQTVSDLLGSWSPFAGDIASRIEEIIQKLEYFVDAKDSLGLREVVVGRNISSQRLPTTSLVDHVSVYGRDDDKDKIIQLLISDGDSNGPPVSVIPIVGMGGIGKTTLAQFVYNDPQVVDHFEEKIWVCVSQEFDIARVTKTILVGLSVSFSSVDDLNTLQVKLRGRLAEKEFLIVLDDVWNEKYENWVQLSLPFADGKRGSKIIVTTRNKGVASIMQTVPIFHLTLRCLQVLSLNGYDIFELPDSIGSLIHLRYLDLSDTKIVSLPDSIGSLIHLRHLDLSDTKIVSLPDSIGSLIHLRHLDLSDTKIVSLPDSIGSLIHLRHLDLSDTKIVSLPDSIGSLIHLRHLDLSDTKIVSLPDSIGSLIHLRHLDLSDTKIVSLPDSIGSLIHLRHLDLSDTKIVSLPDSIGSLIHLLHLDLSDTKIVSLPDSIGSLINLRHLDLSDTKIVSLPDSIGRLIHLRHLELSDTKIVSLPDSIGNLIHLRHLELSYTKIVSLPDSIGNLIHLCHLDLSYTKIASLPDSIGNLIHLRHLDLSGTKIVSLPDSICNLIHLRHLDLSDTKIVSLPDTICRLCNLETFLLWDCRRLTTLPDLLCKLVCLRHLDLRGTNISYMPMQIGKLRSLQQLTNFIVGNQIGSTISELKELHYLRGTLSISNLQNVRHALEAILKNKEHLEKLNLEWVAERTDDSPKDIEVLAKLQPHVKLKHLTITNYGGSRFPDWLGNCSFFGLKSLYLCKCTNCFELPPLGKLPSLQQLTIEGMNMVRKVGSEFYGYDSSGIKPFQSLEKLTFEEMPEWEEWSMLGAEEFCHLLELCISNCPKLKGKFSMHFPCLKKLEIYNWQRLVIEKMELVTDPTTGVVPVHHFSSLQVLRISNISELQCLPLEELYMLTNLKELVISRCPMLHTVQILPLELCRLTNLEELKIFDCPMLNTIQIIGGDHQSVSSQSEVEMKRVNTKFHSLEIEKCPELELPLAEDAQHYYKFLQDLKILGENFDSGPKMFFQDVNKRGGTCDSLKYFPLGFFPKLRSLEIDGCRNFESFSAIEGIQNWTSLQSLRISYCPNMVYFPEGGLPARNLTVIRIYSCEKLKALPKQMSTLLPSLRSLLLMDLPELELLYEDSEHQYKFLQNLTMFGSCDTLKYFPLGFFPNLCSLHIESCKNLESLSGLDGQQNLTSLKYLEIRDCPKMVSFADGGGLPAPNLTSIEIWSCKRLKALPEQMCTLLSSLQSLVLEDIRELDSFPSGGLPNSLSQLTIRYCTKLMACWTEWGLQRLLSLRMCDFEGKCEVFWESFPEECLLPTSLTNLTIKACPNLKSLNPNGLRHLNCLEQLIIWDCPNLLSLPDEGLPSSLLRLRIWGCPPLLKERCQKERGEDWLKISHIPYIYIES